MPQTKPPPEKIGHTVITHEEKAKAIIPSSGDVEWRTYEIPVDAPNPNGEEEGRTLSESYIRKLHIHQGHADKLALIRPTEAPNFRVDQAVVESALKDLPFEVSSRDQIQPPAVGRRRVLWDGHTVMADLWYPVPEDSRQFPQMAEIDKFSRFAAT